MRVHSFSHVAITVADFNRSVRFYWDVFGAPVVGVNEDHDPQRLRTFFGVDPVDPVDPSDPSDPADPRLTIGWVRIPGGATIEVFEFTPGRQPPAAVEWSRPGITHFSMNVRDTARWHDYLVSKGVEIVSPPEQSPKGHTFFFVKDPDGNLIELIDNKHMRPILRWLGPLGGFVFRHTMYRRHYRAR